MDVGNERTTITARTVDFNRRQTADAVEFVVFVAEIVVVVVGAAVVVAGVVFRPEVGLADVIVCGIVVAVLATVINIIIVVVVAVDATFVCRRRLVEKVA